MHYAFFESGPWEVPKEDAEVVREAFRLWKNLPIGIDFVEVHSLGEAEIRIGYLTGDGSWSTVARDALSVAANQRTMSFGWPLDQNAYGLTTAIHEIGHALGMPHEHQNPFAGIVWDEEKVYASLGGPPNRWDRQKTFHKVLRKLDPALYTGSQWDPDSVMEYAFPAGLIKQPVKYRNGIHPPGTISPVDAKWVKSWYPGGGGQAEPILNVSESVTAELPPGGQLDYTLRVDETREYTISSFGATDTVLILFEDVDGKPRFLAGDDDTATDRTATVKSRLRPGRTYHVRLRQVYNGNQGKITLMCW